jgi:hypothetical protein
MAVEARQLGSALLFLQFPLSFSSFPAKTKTSSPFQCCVIAQDAYVCNAHEAAIVAVAIPMSAMVKFDDFFPTFFTLFS